METFWDYVGKKLRLPELERRVVAIEHRIDVLERHVNSSLDQFGDYKNERVTNWVRCGRTSTICWTASRPWFSKRNINGIFSVPNSSVEGYGTTRLELTRPWQHRKLVWTGPETFGSVPEALR